MYLSPCIEWLFAEGEPDVPERIRRAAAAGLRSVEFWDWQSKDMDAVGSALRATGMSLVLFNTEPVARIVDRSTHAAFLAGVETSAALARRLGCPKLVVLSGMPLEGASHEAHHAAIVDALRAAAPIAAKHGITLILEPLNTSEAWLTSTEEGLDIIDEVGHPAVRLLYDIYHSAVMGEAVAEVLGERVDRVAHVQLADAPGRHEPGTGTVDWAAAIGWLRDRGYRGPVGLEYKPTAPTVASMARISRLVPA